MLLYIYRFNPAASRHSYPHLQIFGHAFFSYLKFSLLVISMDHYLFYPNKVCSFVYVNYFFYLIKEGHGMQLQMIMPCGICNILSFLVPMVSLAKPVSKIKVSKMNVYKQILIGKKNFVKNIQVILSKL